MPEQRIVRGRIVQRNDDGTFMDLGPASPPVNPDYQVKSATVPTQIAKAGADLQGSQLGNQKTLGDIVKAQREISQNPISETDQKFINEMRTGTGDMTTLLRDITAAQNAVDRFKPNPDRGVLFNNLVPEEDDWLPTAWAKKAGRGIAGISDQEVKDFQTLKSLQEARVLQAQQAQKGPQTEADALRMKMSDVSPAKAAQVNARILAEAQFDALMNQKEPEFYTIWANTWGSINAKNSRGETAGQVWAREYDKRLKQMRSDPRYIRATGATPPKSGGNDGWQIEEVRD